MKRLYFFLSILFLTAIIYWKTDGFLVSKVLSDLPSDPKWNIGTQNSQEVQSILDQEFYYLDKGHQSFVFASEDGQYVIKLINHQRFSNLHWLQLFPLPDVLNSLRQKYLALRNRRLSSTFRSLALAINSLSEETGIVFVQLNRTNQFKKPLVVIDNLGKRYEIDLNSVEFILQKRVDMLYPALNRLMQEKGEAAFKEGIEGVLDVIFARSEKEIADDDLDIEINMGMIGTKAYIIDVGRFFHERSLRDTRCFEKEVRKSVRFFEEWLEATHPETVAFFKNSLDKRLKRHSSK